MGAGGRASGSLLVNMFERRPPVKTSMSHDEAEGIISFQKYILTINCHANKPCDEVLGAAQFTERTMSKVVKKCS